MKSQAKAIVSICLLGSSLFVGSFSFAETLFPIEETPKQDISVFIWKLASRLQWVFGEIVDLSVGKGSVASTWVVETGSSYLVDIKWHAHQDDIEFLAKKGVIDPNRQKFYPDNYLRRYELAIMYVKYQLVKANKSLPLITMPSIWWFTDVAQNASYAPYIAYGVQQNRLTAFVSKDSEGRLCFLPNTFVKIEEVLRLVHLPVESWTHIQIKRGEFAHLLVQWSVDSLFTTPTSESVQKSVVDVNTATTSSAPILDWSPILSTLKNLFALAR